MQTPIDLLQIKIEKARAALPAETLNAIAAVDWKAAILGMRAKKGYTFEQLGDLELETELLLCGLLAPGGYPKELENRMKISRAQANELVNEMNDLVFKKIREELIKNTERKKIFANKMTPPLRPESKHSPLAGGEDKASLDKGRLEGFGEKKESLPIPGKLELETAHPILAQKLSGSFQIPMVKTDHSLKNLQPSSTQNGTIPKKPVDPYREIPE
ncbi:MAG: hypothetical protein G01um101424_116 [Parcubacteria group bacterium Gr01-1014_24]|nr:MAG: hypothetical protein G01um101424_116 [Parcubacteria group bacterium Gr01-1014_24]